jgi:peptidyl-prolyl cis-trans isomerase SurA
VKKDTITMPQGNVRRHVALGAILCAGLAGACNRATQPANITAATWAVVDGREISKDEVEKAFRANVDPSTLVTDDEILTAKLSIVDDMITQSVLEAKAEAAKLMPTDAEVDKALAERKGSATDAQFELQLSQRALTLDDIKRGIRRELAVNKLIERDITEKSTPTEEEITAFFNSHRAQFNYAEPQYRMAQIVVTPTRDGVRNRLNDDASTPDEAKRKTDMLLERLKGGAQFASLAMDYSEDPQTVAQGGDLGFLPASAFARAPQAIRQAVINAKPGAINMVTANGMYTIILLVASEPAGQRELSTPSVHDGIRDALLQRKEQMLRVAYVTRARNEAKIVNNLARQIVDGNGRLAAK